MPNRRAMFRRLVALPLLLSPGVCASGRTKSHQPVAQNNLWRNTVPGVAYAGSEKCKDCHSDIYEKFRRTDMGRSMASPSDPDQLARVDQPVKVYNRQFNTTYEVFRQGSDLYQSEYQTDAGGHEVFRNSQKIAYVIGAGENGVGYLVRWRNYLVEAPLSFYSKTATWGLSPGYERRDLGFSRPVPPSCAACHSGRPEPAPEGHGLYRDPPFSEAAIGCETCHGPGQLHVEARMKGVPPRGAVDPLIVNPAHLSGWLADNICMRCHQTGDVRILQLGKSYSDFRPGTPLASTVAIFLVPFNPSSPPQDPLLQHYISMRLSKCYRASGGRLHCITCHDPHVEPTAAEAPKYFRDKCLGCHTEKSCTLSLETRLEKNPPDDCAGCHMPKQDLRTISHAALTNHRIIATPSEPFPDAAYHLTTQSLPDLVYLDATSGSTPAPAITLLQAYGELAVSHPQYRRRFEALLAHAAKKYPDNAYVLAALGRSKAQDAGVQPEAIQLLSKAIDAGWTETPDYALLAELLAQSGRLTESVAVLRRGIKVNPLDGGLYRMLVVQLAQLQQYQDALSVLKQGLDIFPQDTVLRDMLKKLERPMSFSGGRD